MIDVRKLLYEICEDDAVYEDGIDLYQSGLLDSFAVMELFTALEDQGIVINATQIDRTRLHTVEGIIGLIREYETHNGEES